MSTQEELNYCYNFVVNLTVESGKVIHDAFQGSKIVETKAGDWDLVTQYDRKVEAILIDNLAKRFPTHKFIAEETVSRSNFLPELTDTPTWIIDPIDGTTNFVHSFPYTCVSIALAVNKELEIGIVYNPVLKQLFTARRGHGAFLNEKPIKSSSVEGRLEAFVSIAHGIRTMGSAALTLCHVAMGTVEGYHSDNLMPWDVAAGVLIIREAGGIVIDTNGGEFNVMSPKLLAVGNCKLAKELVKLIKHADLKTHQKMLLLQTAK
ncbi:inositol monophosphatase 2-like isoform X2 [Pogonomyrmex barbatus]|uniref:Inositol-1-monophosphatase n=1 Tax=Pogonomyrmex barbatus TaxID=144034 RepID=A0A6I9WFN3_9HYME|nr:inositol monophosphatase 2-like isoform X2 [Pogonomyrmex barbatus]